MCDNHNLDNKNPKKRGIGLEHGQEHTKDHNRWSRRDFMTTMGIAGGVGMFMNSLPIKALSSTPLAMSLSNTETDRVLVLVRLKGGNDGLNTIIPLYDYGTYQSYRPTLAIPQNNIVSLNGDFGVPNYAQGMADLWNDGKMKFFTNVGYPDQDFSHFRSSDIWISGENEGETFQTGWLGDYLSNAYPDYLLNPPSIPPAIQIGTDSIVYTGAFGQSHIDMGVSVTNPQELYDIAQSGQLHDMTDLPSCEYGDQLEYIRAVSNSTFVYSSAIKDAFDNGANATTYPATELGQQLELVARLVKGNLGTKLYLVTLDGFDTHANQAFDHQALITDLSDSMKAFFDDLETTGWHDKVLAATFSEFGRRIDENASWGTDHGAGAPLMLFSGAFEDGSTQMGAMPDLQQNFADYWGNIGYETDFRNIYVTLLNHWLCVDVNLSAYALGKFTPIDGIVEGCHGIQPPGGGLPGGGGAPIVGGHGSPIGAIDISATNPNPGGFIGGSIIIGIKGGKKPGVNVNVSVYSHTGQHVAVLHNGFLPNGEHTFHYSPIHNRLPAGNYIISATGAGKKLSKQFFLR